MSQNSKRIWPYSSSRLSKVIDLGVNGKPICGFLLVINCNFSRICYRFRDTVFTLKARQLLILPTTPLFDALARGNPLEFLDETYAAKTREMGLSYGENFIILTSTVFSRPTVTLCIVAKRCVLEQKLLLRAYRKSYMRNRLVPKSMTLTFV